MYRIGSNVGNTHCGGCLCILTLPRSCAEPRLSTTLVERSRAHLQRWNSSMPPLTTCGERTQRRPRRGSPWPQQKLTTSKTSNRDTAQGFNSSMNGAPANECVKDEDLKDSLTCSPSAKGPAQGSNGARPLEHTCHRCEGTNSAICAIGINECCTFLSPMIATNSTRAAGPLGQTLSRGVPLQTPQSAMAKRRPRKRTRQTFEQNG